MNKDFRSMLKNISSTPHTLQNDVNAVKNPHSKDFNQRICVQIANRYQPIEIVPVLKGTWGVDNDLYSNWNISLKNTSIFTIKDFKIEIGTPVINYYHVELSNMTGQKTLLSLPEWKKISGCL